MAMSADPGHPPWLLLTVATEILGAAINPRGCGPTDLAQVSSTDQTGLRHLRAYLVRIVPNRSRTFADGCEAIGGDMSDRGLPELALTSSTSPGT